MYLTKHEHYYVYIGCAIAQNVTHERGKTNVSIAILSETPVFTAKHRNFLQSAISLCDTIQEINPQQFIELYQSEEMQTKAAVSHPCQPFTQKNSVCKLFKGNPDALLTLWRARLCNFRIDVSTTLDIEDATNICYFVAALGMPTRKLDGCIYHVDMCDIGILRGGNWSICAVTHVGMQREEVGKVKIGPNGQLIVDNDVKWLRNGGGVIKQYAAKLIEEGSDESLLKMLFVVNNKLDEALRNKQSIVAEDLNELGLSSGNARFLRLLVSEMQYSASIDVSANIFENCCGC